MEATLQPESLKLTIKLKRDTNVSDTSTPADHLNNTEGEHNASDSSDPPGTLNTFCEDQVDFSSAQVGENHATVNEGNQTSESSQYQMVLYDPAVNDAGNNEKSLDPGNCMPPIRRPHPFADRTPRVLPSVGAFTVQCANCFKWRLIPTKEKYEEIREHIIAQPFFCETAREWHPDISCDDPPDITQDGDRLWAIDKPNIAQPPPGWQRLLRIRGEGGTRYYVAPSGKRLRSVLDIQRYLDKHPEYMSEGVSLSRFSFKIPKPLQENYVRKRPAPARPALQNDAGDLGNQRYLPPSEDDRNFSEPEFARLTWVRTDVDTDLQLSSPALANDHLEAPASNPESQSPKRKRISSPWRYDDDFVFNHNDINVEEPH
ncbi:methyl-CpG-binding domain-containing protein 2-like isoform X2 [Salvia miltiorrhiza]|uniref:methyl-CpG-binding domain-containing protein 2-like isoform X2 n=1 Tax=Salvia miltiorrhiza TaxID=226208 RepID=UPI0025AC987F|nr:methyl-CpG-binding domain-containing protein 2-like isoform X2 [Salvia miltiorrhiza]XP_057768460.1 methyl-CpG-binding domain-containing protein 2-like isoform X2 [Salvia miltiorrhiza]XP_057768465.1 methyl-CpG-binding domain-containing protein 2-like isoform X2 [Salvia miltiorrhiza]XP_057768473.1 methyl-CpG-binding domain-containing protein 2-like isoform X2 [Salvia miltiorrhiza]